MSELKVESRDTNEAVVVYPRGFVNAHTVRLFEGEIQKAIDAERYRIVVNCEGLTYIASAGLGALMGVIEEIRHHGGDIRLAELNETVRNIFEILGFHHLYRIFPSEVEAIRSFSEEGQRGGPGA